MAISEADKLRKINVLMVGPGRKVMGGISTVVNSYYELGLNQKINMIYLPTMEDVNKIKKLILAVNAYLKFRSVVKKCDVVHVHMAAQASYTRKALFVRKAKKAGKKVIIHQHAADFDEFFLKQSDDTRRKDIKTVFGLADKVIVLSEEWEEFFAKNICDSNKIVVIHNGVIIPDYEKKSYDDHGVLFLGRLGKRKGTYDLLKAIPLILKVVPDAMFYLGGDGDVEECKKIATNACFADHLRFLGWVLHNTKEEYFKKCSTFILPSYHEGMPISVLESMAYGLATVSTNAGGIPQIIDNGIDGYRIEAGDVQAFVETLSNLIVDSEKKRILGTAARKKIISSFNAAGNINILCELYQLVAE